MTDKIAILTTCENRLDADKIANTLLDARLAACVNITAVSSVYRWKGEVERSEEYLLIVKTRRELFDEVRALLDRIHPYELPEAIALPIVAGSPSYLEWIEKETKIDESADARKE